MSPQRSESAGRADSGRVVAGTATKHSQLRDSLLQLIMEDSSRGRMLPSERELASAYGVSRMTMRQVVEEFADSGYVYRVQGLGTFVDRPQVSKSLLLTSFTEDMLARGLRPGSRVLEVRERAAGAATGSDLQLSPVEPVVYVRRVRLADDVPMCLETIEIPARLVPGLRELPLTGSMYNLLATRYRIRIAHAEQRIRATVLDSEEADLLEVPALSPAMLVERVSSDRAGRSVERARSLYRGDRYDFRVAVDRRTRG
ncbi:MAG: GntR family transcriptional regulator [Jatrophihabitantaceae bacterium]